MIHEYKNVRSVIQWSGFCAKVLFIFKENKTVKDFQIMPHRKSFWPPLRIIMPLLGTFCPNRGKKLEKWAKSANISDNELTSICFKLTTKCALNRPFCLNNKWIAVEVLQSGTQLHLLQIVWISEKRFQNAWTIFATRENWSLVKIPCLNIFFPSLSRKLPLMEES